MSRRVRANASPALRRRRPEPVRVRHVFVFEDLLPVLRASALERSGGDPSRVVVLAPNRYEVAPR